VSVARWSPAARWGLSVRLPRGGAVPTLGGMSREAIRSAAWGLAASIALAAAIVVGSRNLAHFDAALVAYTFAVLFATFGLTYRYVMWLQRPPTALYWRRGWQAFLDPRHLLRNVGAFLGRMGSEVAANGFIFRRDALRGLTHLLIMWGCILAVAITFPLVFGWLHFRPVAGDLSTYETVIFGWPVFRFPHRGAGAFFMFHGLVWVSVLVILGVMLAMRRRMRNEGPAAVQRFVEDFLPLILLFAVSMTGLLLTASYTWMKGYGYVFLAIFHAITVIGTFLWLPFGKFFHVFQRPAQLGVGFYKDAGVREGKAACRRCGHAFTTAMKVRDLVAVERALGYRYEIPGDPVEHYQWICPPCRRAAYAAAQGAAWRGRRGGAPMEGASLSMPAYANPGMGEGPLGAEDRANFHP